MFQMRKQELLDAVRTATTGNTDSMPLIKQLDAAIPDDSTREFFDGYDNQTIQKAINLYQRWHPEHGKTIPTLPDVILWLMKRDMIPYANELEMRMGKIFAAAMKPGVIDPSENVVITGMDLLNIRVLSNGSSPKEEE